MPRLHALFAGAAALAFAATAPVAAAAAPPEWRTTTVDLPDGSKAQVRYVGDIPPQITVSMPVVQDPRGAVVEEEVVEEEYIADAGIPRARRVVQAQPLPAAPQSPPPQFVVAGDAPRGSTYHYTLITTGADGRVCTQRTEWKSRGPGKEPEVRLTDTGDGCAPLAGSAASAPPARLAPAPSAPPSASPRIVPAPPVPAPTSPIPQRIEPVDPDTI